MKKEEFTNEYWKNKIDAENDPKKKAKLREELNKKLDQKEKEAEK